MGRIFSAVCIVAVVIPWLLRSLNDGSINLNRLTLNLVSTVQEIITRQPAQWQPPQVQPAPDRQDGGQL